MNNAQKTMALPAAGQQIIYVRTMYFHSRNSLRPNLYDNTMRVHYVSVMQSQAGIRSVLRSNPVSENSFAIEIQETSANTTHRSCCANNDPIRHLPTAM